MKHNSMLTTLAFCVLAPLGITAQTLNEGNENWNEGYVNGLCNVQYAAANPVRISHNSLKTFGVALVSYSLGRGSFHAADGSGNTDDMCVYIGGMKNLGKIDLSGSIKYSNIQAGESKWNSTLYLTDSNPFVLCDSVAGNTTTESFELEVAGSYIISDRWRAGMSLGLKMGSLSDQTDPRPATNSSVLPISIGAEYAFSKALRLGLSAGYRHYRSTISYAIVNPLNSHRFFLMKGMGDYYRFSSAEVSGYEREYKGGTFTGALHLDYEPAGGKVRNFTEIKYSDGDEDATDGGSSFTFHGGDYSFSEFVVSHRLSWQARTDVHHNFAIAVSCKSGEGTWRDQKKLTDTEHGNMSYYQTLGKYKVHEDSRLKAGLGYRLDLLKGGVKDFFASVDGGIVHTVCKHFLSAGVAEQKVNVAYATLAVGKSFAIDKVTCSVNADGGYYLPRGKTYGNGNSRTSDEDISSVYTRPQFEYESAERLVLGGKIDASAPVRDNIRLGVYASTACNIYRGDSEYWSGYASEKYITTALGIYLNF